MAVPVLRRHSHAGDRVLAVIQMINKMEFDGCIGKFDDEDIQVMETFATFVASKLETSSLLGGSSGGQAASGNEASAAFGGPNEGRLSGDGGKSPSSRVGAGGGQGFGMGHSSAPAMPQFAECDEEDDG